MFKAWWNVKTQVCCKFTTESASEKILKIGLYLVKLWPRVWCLVFLTHGVYVLFIYYARPTVDGIKLCFDSSICLSVPWP